MNILMNFRAYPMALGRYFEFAFKDLGHNVIVAGSSKGDLVPWGDQYRFPKYNFQPDILLPDWEKYPLETVLKKLPEGFKPDYIFQVGDVCWLEGPAPKGVKNLIIATDPHAVDYSPRLANADAFFCMQNYYMRQEKYAGFENKKWIPYAYSKNIHKRILGSPIKYDVVFCGLQYEPRVKYLTAVADKGFKVFNQLGVLYKEYNEVYNSGIIAFNHSSLLDLPARFWEGMAMGNLVLTNDVPELETIASDITIKLKAGVHYLKYASIEEAIELTEYYLKHPQEAQKIAQAGYKAVQGHTYERRINKIWQSL